jgi:hypothetical protein
MDALVFAQGIEVGVGSYSQWDPKRIRDQYCVNSDAHWDAEVRNNEETAELCSAP